MSAHTILHVITAWIDQLPAGTVDMTYTLFPSDDDYGSELLVTLRPYKSAGGVLTIGVISDTTFPFHFHLGAMNEIATAAGLTLSYTVPAQLQLFWEHRSDVSPMDVVALCRAVAAAQIRLNLSTFREQVWAAEAWVTASLGLRSLHAHGSSGPLRLVNLLCRLGYGTIRTPTFAPWN